MRDRCSHRVNLQYCAFSCIWKEPLSSWNSWNISVEPITLQQSPRESGASSASGGETGWNWPQEQDVVPMLFQLIIKPTGPCHPLPKLLRILFHSSQRLLPKMDQIDFEGQGFVKIYLFKSQNCDKGNFTKNKRICFHLSKNITPNNVSLIVSSLWDTFRVKHQTSNVFNPDSKFEIHTYRLHYDGWPIPRGLRWARVGLGAPGEPNPLTRIPNSSVRHAKCVTQKSRVAAYRRSRRSRLSKHFSTAYRWYSEPINRNG